MAWRPIPAISQLVKELDEHYPNRTKPDWIIGDADHSSRVSDHNPEDRDPGERFEEVHAIDIRLGGGLDVSEVLKTLIGDVRVWYVIHNRKIYSRTYGWRARRYKGSNPHTTHIHVSFRYGNKYERDTSKFFDEKKTRTRPLPIDLSLVRNEFLKALDLAPGEVKHRWHVRRVQRALNVRNNADLKVDGIVGRATLQAWRDWERRPDVPNSGRPGVPDKKTLSLLLMARWRMVA